MSRRHEIVEAAERLRLVHQALDIQRERTLTKIGTVHSRASFVIAADALVVGIRSTATGHWDPLARWFPLAVLVSSAAFAVVVLVGTQVEEVAPEDIRELARGKRPDIAEYEVYRAKLKSLETSRRDLRWRERLLRVGTLLLLGAIAVVAAQSVGASEPFRSVDVPSPAVTRSATMSS